MFNLRKLILLFLIFSILLISVGFITNFSSFAYNSFRFYTLYGGGENCLKKLTNYSNEFVPLGTFTEGKCKVKNAIKVISYKKTALSSPIILTCPTAVKVGKYFEDIMAQNVKHMGSYNCRTIANSKIMSEHSYGSAIDISEIDGAKVIKDWNKNTEKGKVLKNAYKKACKYFSNFLTPDNNKAHHDHFHFDTGYGVRCIQIN